MSRDEFVSLLVVVRERCPSAFDHGANALVSFAKGIRAIVPQEIRRVELGDPIKARLFQMTAVVSWTNLLFCSLTSSSAQRAAAERHASAAAGSRSVAEAVGSQLQAWR